MRSHVERRRVFLATVGAALLAVLVLLVLMTAPRLRAQLPAATGDRPTFEAVSIKPYKWDGVSPRINVIRTQPGGRFTASNATLRMLIGNAYQLTPGQSRVISNPPTWIDSARFDIEAKAEGNPPREEMLLMRQSLLADRFKLLLHHETQQLPIYALVVSKAGRTGQRLQSHSDSAECALPFDPSRPFPAIDPEATPPPPPPCGGFIGGTTRLAGNKVTIEMLTTNLGALVDRPVVDRTGLSGVFDLVLRFTRQQPPTDAAASDPSAPPDIFTALQEQLGLKLEATKGPVDVLVIDHVEMPSEN